VENKIPETKPLVPTQEPKPEKEVEIAKSNFELRDKTKIFVGNLPLWVNKEEICRLFRQFGPLKKVELIKGHDSPERNVGYFFMLCQIMYQ
jgi:RNA recognition motif-containing protein